MVRIVKASSNNFLNLVLEVNQRGGSINQVNNTSIVDWKLIIEKKIAYYGYSLQNALTYNVSINGTQVVNRSGDYDLRNAQSQVLASGNLTVTHNSDGSKSIPISANIYNIPQVGNITGLTGTAYLSTIARGSKFTVENANIGEVMSIRINRTSSSFRHNIRYSWYNKSGHIARGVDIFHSWTIPENWAEDIPNSTESWATIYVDTYIGDKWISTDSQKVTVTLPSYVRPHLEDIVLTDTNAKVTNLLGAGNYLQSLSNIKVDFIGATGIRGSTVKRYIAQIVDRQQTTTEQGGKLGVMNFHSEEVTIAAAIFDSRGKISNGITKKIKVLEYYPPQLAFSVRRSGGNNQTITVVRTAKVAPLIVNGRQLNRFNLSFKTKLSSDSSYSSNAGAGVNTVTYHSLTGSPANLIGNFPSEKSYTILGTLRDEFRTTESTDLVSTEQVVLSYHKDGLGVGKFKERGALDVNGDIYAHNLFINGNKVQEHQVTLSDGRVNLIAINPDDIIKSGFYYLLNGPNRPFNTNGYLVVETFDPAKWIKQTFTHVYTGAIYIRLRKDGVWQSWKEVCIIEPKEATMINAGGYSGSSKVYRRGSSVTLQLSVNGKFRSSRNRIGSIPREYIPNYITNNYLIYHLNNWSKIVEVRIDSNGNVEAMSMNGDDIGNRGLSATLTWTI